MCMLTTTIIFTTRLRRINSKTTTRESHFPPQIWGGEDSLVGLYTFSNLTRIQKALEENCCPLPCFTQRHKGRSLLTHDATFVRVCVRVYGFGSNRNFWPLFSREVYWHKGRGGRRGKGPMLNKRETCAVSDYTKKVLARAYTTLLSTAQHQGARAVAPSR